MTSMTPTHTRAEVEQLAAEDERTAEITRQQYTGSNAVLIAKYERVDRIMGIRIAALRHYAASIGAEPVAWMHILRKEVFNDPEVRVTTNPSHPFGVSGKDFDPSFAVETRPLYAAPVHSPTYREGELSGIEKTDRESIGRDIYLALYQHKDGRWEANETRDVWYEIADRFVSLRARALAKET
ncbi:hypothetical protein LB518_23035 [Mesorhizobium sp. BR1-1-16]|uniref:hypothetical protein n=1 Tax=Mesorhizobium sp. BR1-1-16 TaxID=2876653 RepID=UPI001CCE5A9D|nr:hypothetical protein [Mesorhizobium sp. BR1-1-16]MBZ9939191.1 hypothetical protein [Mesorhizobium sp. BR1-1-16]